MTALFRRLAVDYGNAIPFPSLRHAILARSALALPRDQFREKMQRHKEQAWRMLIRKIDNLAAIDEGDVIAACLLAQIAHNDGQSAAEVSIHVNGCLALYRHLLDSHNKPVAPLLAIFGPFILDRVSFHGAVACASSESWLTCELELPHRRATFGERLNYYTEIRKTGHPSEGWQRGIIEAVHNTLGDLIIMLASSIHGVAARETMNDFKKDSKVRAVVRYAEIELADPDFHRLGLKELEQLEKNSGTFEGDLAKFLIQQVACIRLAIKVLEKPSIVQGVRDLEANSMAEELISRYLPMSPTERYVKEFYVHGTLSVVNGLGGYSFNYPFNLLLGGMALSKAKISEGNWLLRT